MRKRRDQIARKLFFSSRLMETPEQRKEMASLLQFSDDPELRRLARDAVSPTFKGTSFAQLADNLGIGIQKIERGITAIRKSEGYIRASQHLPDLMEQSMEDAKSKWVKCYPCDGSGQVLDNLAMTKALKEAKERGEPEDSVDRILITCNSCKGEGQVYVMGEVERVKLAFETFELIGKGRGLNVNLDLRRVDQSEGLEELSQSVAGILEGKVE